MCEAFAGEEVPELWSYRIYEVQADETFSAAADISYRGERCCKLVICVPHTSRREGLDHLKRLSVEWIANERWRIARRPEEEAD